MPSTKKKKGRAKMRRQVRRDVWDAYKPVLKGLGQQRDAAKETSERDLSRAGNIYDNLAQTFRPLNRQFNRGSEQILQGTNQALSGIAGGNMEGGLQELLGTLGQGYSALLGTGMQGTLGNIAGLQAGALADKADLESNVMARYRDFVNDLKLQRTDTKAQRAQTFLEELNRRREFRLAQKEQEIRAQQFDKQFKAGRKDKKQENSEERKGRRTAAEIARDRDDDKAAKRTLRKTRGRVPTLNESIEDIQKQIEGFQGQPGTTPETIAQLEELQAELRKLKKRRRNVRRKRRSAKRELKD